jgi:hypothetical protein
MKSAAGVLLGVTALVVGAISLPSTARAATPACHAMVRGSDAGFYPVPMQRSATAVEEDPLAVWTKYELWTINSPAHTTIWQGTFPVCGGQVIVSQIINRQCSSATACPARVVFRDGQKESVLLDYKQLCTLHTAFEMRGDSGQLRACDETFRLKPVRTD